MNKLESLYNDLKGYDVLKVIREQLKRSEVQELIVNIIQTRLYDKGETPNGGKLRTDFARSSNKRLKGDKGFYSKRTESIKKSKGQKIDNVTLKDTGEFYDSFKTDFKTDRVELSADFRDIYDNFQDSFSSEEEFEKAILNIMDEEKQEIFEFIYPDIIESFNGL